MKNYHIIRFLSAIMAFLLIHTEGGAQGIQTFQSIRLYHPNTQGQYIGLVPPSSITSYNLTLPNTQGSANSLLLNDGNGNLSWNTVSGFAWGLTGNSSTSWANHFLGTTDNVSLRFRTNNAERMILDSVGRLAVGVSSALGRLHIQEPINTVNKFVLSGDNAAPNTKIASILFNRFNYDPTGNAAEIAVWRGNAATEGTIAFSTNPGSATGQQPTERMRINSNGLVGINTVTPSYRLDIDANTGSTGNPLRLQGLQAGATSDSLLSSASGVVRRLAINQILANTWTITGNAGTVDGTNFIGTTDNIPLNFRVNNQKAGRIGTVSETYFGYQAGMNTTGINNTFVGFQAGVTNTTGFANTGIGFKSLQGNTTGVGNAAIGEFTLYNNTTGGYNMAMGGSTLFSNTIGSENTAIGAAALFTNTAGTSNVAIGRITLYNNTTGANNVALGSYALYNNTTAWGNTAVGFNSLYSNTTGQGNVAVGDSAAYAGVTANNITAIGYKAGLTNTTGTNNTFLGYQANAASSALTNATAIGSNAVVGASNSLVLGGTGTNAVNVGINTTTPQYRLDIDANTGSAGNPLRLLGLQAGATSDSLLTSASGVVRRLAINQLGTGNFWKIGGNTEGGVRNLGTTDNYGLPFITNNTERMRITEAGNVGIGTSAPTLASRLNVVGGDIVLGSITPGLSTFPDSSKRIIIRGDNGDNSDPLAMYAYYGSADYTQFRLSVGDNGNSVNDALSIGSSYYLDNSWANWATFRSNGLGINTMTPAYKLDIDANTGSTGNPLRLLGLQAGATTDSLLTSASGVVKRLAINQLGTGNFWKIGGNTEGGVRNLGTTDNYGLPFITNNTERMRITEAGNVGIGTSAPTAMLQINMSTGGTIVPLRQGIYVNGGLTSTNGYKMFEGVGGSTFCCGTIYGLKLDFTSSTNGTNYGLYVEGDTYNYLSNKLGIGTATPQYRLDIDANTGSTGNPLRLQGLQAGATTDSLLSSASGVVRRLAPLNSTTWALSGNSGTNASTNFLGTTDNVDMVLKTANVERMRIYSGGIVDIQSSYLDAGATGSGPGLIYRGGFMMIGDVNNNQTYANGLGIKFNDAGVQHASISYLPNSSLLQFGKTSNHGNLLPFDTRATLSLNVSSNNVGINTSAPAYKLDIDANTGSTGNPLRLQGLQAGATTDSLLSAASGVVRRLAPLNSSIWTLTGNSGTNASTNFLGTTDAVDFILKTNNTERIRVASDGKVGVNTNIPLGLFDVVSTSAIAASRVTQAYNADAVYVSKSGADVGNAINIADDGGLAGVQITKTTTATLRNNNLRAIGIDATYQHNGGSGGGKGIEVNVTNNSTSAGTVWGTDITATGNAAGTTVYGLRVNAASSSGTAFGVYSGSGTNYFAGNVGIGTTTPSEKLYVAGNIYATGTIVSSDRRFKKNIQPIADPLQKVMAIKGVSYEMRLEEFPTRGFKAGTQIGFIAQDLEKVVPEVVSTQADGYKGVDYERITALLVEAVKQQQQKIEQLEKENNALKNQASDIEALKKQMAEIKALLDKK